ncbi:MAG: MaoC family dehydratase [Candidatus Sungbacteria bacterium]|nr:MaoC family dehydratase [Candidatus Sungbacteria bacterium]
MRFNSLPWIWIDGCDIDRFALATGDFNPLHFNNSFAATTVLGGLAVHGELVVNTLFGALHTVDFWHGTLEALLEKYVKFILPVRPGDRVKHYLHITETKESKKYPDKGIVRFEFFTENQRYENVAEGWFCVLMRKNPANIKKKEAD